MDDVYVCEGNLCRKNGAIEEKDSVTLGGFN